jgi:hypothetical protein
MKATKDGCTKTGSVTATIKQQPAVPNLTAGSSVCGDNLHAFSFSNAGTASIIWWLNNATTANTGESVNIVMPLTGSNTVKVEVDLAGCTASASKIVTRTNIDAPVVQDIIQNDPGVALLTATTAAGTTVKWLDANTSAELGEGTTYNPTVDITTSYLVQAATTDCQSTKVPVTVTIVFPDGRVLYARASGNWNDPNTWSNIQGGSPLTVIPNNATQVFIDGYEVTVDTIAESGPIELKDNTGTLTKLNVLTDKELKVFGQVKMSKTAAQNLVKINVEEEGKLSCVEP